MHEKKQVQLCLCPEEGEQWIADTTIWKTVKVFVSPFSLGKRKWSMCAVGLTERCTSYARIYDVTNGQEIAQTSWSTTCKKSCTKLSNIPLEKGAIWELQIRTDCTSPTFGILCCVKFCSKEKKQCGGLVKVSHITRLTDEPCALFCESAKQFLVLQKFNARCLISRF